MSAEIDIDALKIKNKLRTNKAENWQKVKNQRWSPRGRPWPQGHILKSLASKVKSLASRPQVLENWPVLGSRTALFFGMLKFLERLKNFLENVF